VGERLGDLFIERGRHVSGALLSGILLVAIALLRRIYAVYDAAQHMTLRVDDPTDPGKRRGIVSASDSLAG